MNDQYKRLKKYFAAQGEELTQEDYKDILLTLERCKIEPTDEQIIYQVELMWKGE